jgi:glycine cleavage system H protein
MKHAILSCNGLDKPEGSLAREVAILGSETTGGDIICPVLLNRAPARYRKALSESSLTVVDGCSTRCASKLATRLLLKIDRKILISDALKASSPALESSLRLGSNGLALAHSVIDQLICDLNAPSSPVEPSETWETPTEFVAVTVDKFIFRIPIVDFLFNENDVYAHLSEGVARIGISDYMQESLTDIGFFEPPEIGIQVEQFGEAGTVESAKAIFEIISPVSGTITAVNSAVVDNTGLINQDPYGAGWLVEIKLSNFEQDRELLLDGAAYAETVKRKAMGKQKGDSNE